MAFTRRFQSAIAQSVIAGVLLVSVAACAPTATREGTGEYIDDSVITSKVKAAYAADPTVKATQVQVETFKGTVQLSGFVDSRESAQRAVEIARGIKGVKSVKNDTVIR
jgi:osmotically-inducible protein OsmY